VWIIFQVVKKGAYGNRVELNPHQCTGATSEVNKKKKFISFCLTTCHKINSEKQDFISCAR